MLALKLTAKPSTFRRRCLIASIYNATYTCRFVVDRDAKNAPVMAGYGDEMKADGQLSVNASIGPQLEQTSATDFSDDVGSGGGSSDNLAIDFGSRFVPYTTLSVDEGEDTGPRCTWICTWWHNV